MIPNGLLSQIIITALSVGIIVSYVMPTFDKIATHQNEIDTYKAEQEKVSAVNTKLSQLSASINNISSDNQERLLTYMPDSIDTIDVPRTLEAISLAAGVTINEITYQDTSDQDSALALLEAEPTIQPKTERFTLDVDCSYSQFKQLLFLLEQNEFPLEVTDMEVTKKEGGNLNVKLLLTTYSHTYGGSAPVSDGTVNEAITL
jgi:uncharacterized membrane protein